MQQLENGLPPAVTFVVIYKYFPMTIKGDGSSIGWELK